MGSARYLQPAALHTNGVISEWNYTYKILDNVKDNQLSYRFLIAMAFLAIYLIWGTTYLAIVIGLKSFPPFLMAAIRFVIAGVLLVGYSLWSGEGLPSGHSILKNSFIGLIVLAGGQGLLMWSEQYIASGYASVLIATLPVWFVVMDRVNWKLYFSNAYILSGVAIGFIGIVILFKDKLNEPMGQQEMQLQILASLAVIAGAICWVIGTLYNRSSPAPGSIYKNLGWQLLGGSVICLIISAGSGEWTALDWSNTSWQSWGAIAYLSIAGSIVAFVAYTWLLNEKPAAIVGTYSYINPIVAVFLGWLLADEAISSSQLIGMTIVLFSAIIININRSNATLRAKKVSLQN
jgi:drug/metabolite transporter (DMT)-like permease